VPNNSSRGKSPAVETQLRSEIASLSRQVSLDEPVRLGSESALAARFGVARNTLRSALTRLADEGLIHSEPARGWFVGTRPDAAPGANLASIVRELREEARAATPGAEFATAPGVADRFGVALHIARQALTILGTEGLLVSKHGKGWFVSEEG